MWKSFAELEVRDSLPNTLVGFGRFHYKRPNLTKDSRRESLTSNSVKHFHNSKMCGLAITWLLELSVKFYFWLYPTFNCFALRGRNNRVGFVQNYCITFINIVIHKSLDPSSILKYSICKFIHIFYNICVLLPNQNWNIRLSNDWLHFL